MTGEGGRSHFTCVKCDTQPLTPVLGEETVHKKNPTEVGLRGHVELSTMLMAGVKIIGYTASITQKVYEPSRDYEDRTARIARPITFLT